MDGPRIGSDHYNGIGNRRKKIQIFSTNKGEQAKRQQYYESNPYALNRSPTTPVLQRTQTSPDSLSNRDNATETSSQRSAKVIRTNGLSRAQKPNISQSRAVGRPVVHKISGSRIGPAFSTGYPQSQPQLPIIYQQYGIPYQKQQPIPLVQQNNRLREQNKRLKQQMLRNQRVHVDEVNTLKMQIDRVFKMVHELEDKIRVSDKEWENYCKEHNK